MIWAFALFVLAVLTIAALRRRLLFEIQGSSLLITGSTRSGLVIYSILMFPGTIIHELSHWLVAEILQVRTGEITLIPASEGKGDTSLGSVATVRTDPFRGFLIGLAPFITGILSLFLLGYYLKLGWETYPWWVTALLIYGQIVVGNSMIMSKSDMRYWPFIAILLGLVLVVFAYSGINLPASNFEFLVSILESINAVLGLTIILSLAMILVLYFLRRALERATRKRVTI